MWQSQWWREVSGICSIRFDTCRIVRAVERSTAFSFWVPCTPVVYWGLATNFQGGFLQVLSKRKLTYSFPILRSRDLNISDLISVTICSSIFFSETMWITFKLLRTNIVVVYFTSVNFFKTNSNRVP